MQDIFEKIDNFRGGGDGGAVRLKDLIRFLRGVCENIDQNFKVGDFFKSFFCLCAHCQCPGDFAVESAVSEWGEGGRD